MARPSARIRQLLARVLAEQTETTRPVSPTTAYERLRNLAPIYRETLTATGELTPFEYRVFSQNGEDGVIAEILRRIGATSRFFVEFGVGEGLEGNCVLLADVFGWSGLFIEADDAWFAALEAKYRHSPHVRTVRALVTPSNVNDLFAAADVPDEPDVLSIDIDTHDYWVWDAIVGYRPKLVVIEYNAALDPEARLVKPRADDSGWDETDYYGASLGAMRSLGEAKGYHYVHADLSGANAFFVRSDLASALDVVNPPVRPANFYLAGLRLPPDPQGRRYTDLDADE